MMNDYEASVDTFVGKRRMTVTLQVVASGTTAILNDYHLPPFTPSPKTVEAEEAAAIKAEKKRCKGDRSQIVCQKRPKCPFCGSKMSESRYCYQCKKYQPKMKRVY